MDALQYGALGLLALVLSAIGLWARQFLTQQAEAAREQAEAAAEAAKEQQAFVQEIAKGAIKNNEEHATAWETMTRQTLEVQSQFTQFIDAEFRARRQEHNDEAQQRHAEHEVICRALENMPQAIVQELVRSADAADAGGGS